MRVSHGNKYLFQGEGIDRSDEKSVKKIQGAVVVVVSSVEMEGSITNKGESTTVDPRGVIRKRLASVEIYHTRATRAILKMKYRSWKVWWTRARAIKSGGNSRGIGRRGLEKPTRRIVE